MVIGCVPAMHDILYGNPVGIDTGPALPIFTGQAAYQLLNSPGFQKARTARIPPWDPVGRRP